MKTIIAVIFALISVSSFATQDIIVSGTVPAGHKLVRVYVSMESQTESLRCATYEVAGLGVFISGVKYKEVQAKVEFLDNSQFTAAISAKKLSAANDSFCRYQLNSGVVAEFISSDGQKTIQEL